jgi:hypothetical protein
MTAIRSTLLRLGLIASLPLAGSALAQQTAVGGDPVLKANPDDSVIVDETPLPDGPIGFLHPERDQEERARRKLNLEVAFPEPLEPFLRLEKVDHVANGVALRNRARGYIHLRGVPLRSTVVRSFLFWNFSDGDAVGTPSREVLFDGNLVPGRKIADNSDPCWGHVGNHSYMADVTRYTNQSGGPNQDYEVVLPFPRGTSTTGQNPWLPFEPQAARLQGATLVVIYQNEGTSGPLALYTPPGDNMFFGNALYVLATPGAGPAHFTSIGADGQRGFGHNNFASNETTFFNAPQIAGPPVAASDWDGSDGLPLPQLWDTHTHIVNSQPISAVRYFSGGDCLVPVGFVVDLQ